MNDFEMDLYQMEASCINKVFNVHSEYCTEATLRVKIDIKDKVKKILKAIKDFFIKLKKKISDKLREMKVRRALSGIAKLVRGGSYEITVNGKKVDYVDFDISKDLIDQRLELFVKDAKRIMKIKNPRIIETKFNKLFTSAVNDIDAYITMSKQSKPGHIHKNIVRRMKIKDAAKKVLDEAKNINSDLDDIYSKLSNIVKESTSIKNIFIESAEDNEFDKRLEPYMEAENIGKSIGDTISNVAITISTKCSALAAKVAGFISEHPFQSAGILYSICYMSKTAGYHDGFSKGNRRGFEDGFNIGAAVGVLHGRGEV